MSTAKLIITAVTVQNLTQAETARRYGLSKGWVSKVMAQYRLEGMAACEPRSRTPHTSPTATPRGVIEAVLAERDRIGAAGHDAGPETISAYLARRDITVSRATVARILTRHARVVPEPKKKPKSALHRFEAVLPNETWQSDFTHYRLSTGVDTEIITWLDDHSRMALHVTAHPRVGSVVVVTTFRDTYAEHGVPASVLTDNGLMYTSKLASRKVAGGRNAFEAELAHLGVIQKNGRGGYPQTQGKVERFQQTLKKWLRQQRQPDTLEQLQALIDIFVAEYNNDRPHRSLNRHTPRAAYLARPKDHPPTEPAPRTHTRVRADKVNNGKITLRHAGTMFHIGLGRRHNGLAVTALIQDLDITIIDTTTGEILRELTLDTTRQYQPQT